MANIKELIQSIESTDSSFDEKLDAINKMEETLVALRQQEETAVQDNVDLIVEAIKVMENKVTKQLEVAKSIVPEKGDKGDKGDKGADGRQGIDGKNGQDGRNGKDGIDGKDGVSVSNAQIDFDGSLVITLSTGQEINVGEVVAPELQERIKLVTSGGAGTVLPDQSGNANKYLKTSGTTLSWDALNGSDIDLSSPPAIGATSPSTGKFTTLESTGTASLATGSTTSIQIVGDASYPQIKAVGGTNTPLVLQPLGTGALQAQKTDSTATGGNARGANAVDWQTSRASATQVASGGGCVVSGGYANSATTGYSVVGGGYNNTSGYIASVLGGQQNQSTGTGHGVVVAGYANTANGYLNFVGGGYSNSGTSSASVTTQSGTMNGTTTVTLSGSNASIKVGQLITGTSIATYTYVAAISGTSLTLSQAASGSSTSTLSFYTPHGVVVGGGNNQATGSYSFIGGGGDAGISANRNVASGDWSFVGGGFKNQSQNPYSTIGGGFTNTSSNTYSVVAGGSTNTASGAGAFVGAGVSNFANGTYSAIMGGYQGITRGISGFYAFPANVNPLGFTVGASQGGLLVIARETTNATATVLTSDANAAGGTNQVILPNNSAYYFRGEVVAGVTGGGNTSAWTFEGAIKRGAGVGTTAIVGTPVINLMAQDSGASTWVIAITADTTNGGLAVTVTGQAATTIRWVCQVRTTEMTY
jgi:hypothetical protein